MSVKKLAQAGACGLVLAFSCVGAAEARVMLGANFGIGQFDYPDIDDGSATAFYLGYELDESPVYFELAKIDTGEGDIDGFNSVTFGVDGIQYGVGYRIIMNPDVGSDFFLKAGIYKTDSTIRDPDGELCGFPCKVEDGNSGLYIGLGGTLMLAPQFGLRFDMQGLLGVEDFVDDNNVTMIMFGPVVKFGGPSQ
jgi:hypothetical protein